MRLWNRRQFLASATATGVFSLSSRSLPSLMQRGLLVGVLVDDTTSGVSRGLLLGGSEAIRSAALFGQNVELFTQEIGTADAQAGLRSSLDRHPDVLVSGLADQTRSKLLFDLSALRDVWILNAAAAADTLRSPCMPHVFHVAASDTMSAAALRSAEASSAPNGRTARAVMWDPSLERFGAEQLNARFNARFSGPMTGEAWAGWMSMKVAVESFLRTRATDLRTLMTWVNRPDTRFDGHKGMPLSFRSSDHQLRQPMYIVDGSGTVTQVPARGSEVTDNNDPLDALLGPVTAPCR
jgi:hypothetical protein